MQQSITEHIFNYAHADLIMCLNKSVMMWQSNDWQQARLQYKNVKIQTYLIALLCIIFDIMISYQKLEDFISMIRF